MKTIKILLLGMGGNVSQGILKAIRASSLDCYIIGACVSANAEGLYFCDKAVLSPYADSSEFLPWLFQMCRSEDITIVFSGVEEIIDAISPEREQLFSETGAVFRASSPDKLKIGRDKFFTCHWLEENGFRAPGCCISGDPKGAETLQKQYGFPLIAKPRRGKGSNGVFLIKDNDDLNAAVALPDYVIQQCVGDIDHEYTVGCYYGLSGFVPEPIVMRRVLKSGASWKAEVAEHPAIQEVSKKICSVFRPDGPLNIQLRLDKSGIPVPFELNVRFSGTTPMRTYFGFRDVEAMLRESVLGMEIEDCFSVRKGMAIRYINELYLLGDEENQNFPIGTHLLDVRRFVDTAGIQK